MALDVVQVKGCYVSSSLPKALYIPATSKYKSQRISTQSPNVLYLKPGKNNIQQECTNFSKHISSTNQNTSVQTDLYLEELCDVIEAIDAECETDPLLDRPPSPLFVPAKSGLDAATQIYPGELFDFTEEVEPILEALVGQTLEQALIEIMAEDELVAISDMQKDYEVRRNAELAELRRLEEEERRSFEEKQRRLKEQEEQIKLESEVSQKIAACVFAQSYLSQLVPEVYKKLETQGYFETEDPDVKDIEEQFWPWLLNEVDTEIATLEASYSLLDSLICDAVEGIAETSIIQPVASEDLEQKLPSASEEIILSKDFEQKPASASEDVITSEDIEQKHASVSEEVAEDPLNAHAGSEASEPEE